MTIVTQGPVANFFLVLSTTYCITVFTGRWANWVMSCESCTVSKVKHKSYDPVQRVWTHVAVLEQKQVSGAWVKIFFIHLNQKKMLLFHISVTYRYGQRWTEPAKPKCSSFRTLTRWSAQRVGTWNSKLQGRKCKAATKRHLKFYHSDILTVI